MKTKKQSIGYAMILSILLVAAGIFLRFYRIKAFAMFLGDQGRDAMIIKRIVTFEHFPAIGAPSSIGGVFLGPFYYYLVAPFLWLFQLDPIGLTIGVTFISSLGLVLSFYVLRKEVNIMTALIFLVLLVFSLVNIDLSRFSWNPNLLPLFAFATLYCFYKTLQSKHIIYAVATGTLFGLSFQLHHLAALLILPMGLFWIILIKKDIFKKESILNIAAMIGSFIFISAPLILFDLKHQFLNTKSLLGVFTNQELVTTKVPLVSRFTQTVDAFFSHVFQAQLPDMLSIFLFITLLIFFIWRYSKIDNLFMRLLSLNFFLFIIGFSLLNSQRHPHYFGVAYYSFYAFVAYILSTIRIKNFILYPLITLLLVGYIAANAKNYYFFYNIPNNQIQNAKDIADEIAKLVDKTPYQIVPLPIWVTDGHIRYFLEKDHIRPLAVDDPNPGEQLFVLCFQEPCKPTDDPQWQIAAFHREKSAKVDTIKKLEVVTIYKVVHEK